MRLDGYLCSRKTNTTATWRENTSTVPFPEKDSESQSLRQVSRQIFATPADSGIRPSKGIPCIHGDVYIHNVRNTDVSCLGRLGRDGEGFLDHHPDHDYCRSHSLLHLRTEDMVFLLPNGDTLLVGNSKKRQAA